MPRPTAKREIAERQAAVRAPGFVGRSGNRPSSSGRHVDHPVKPGIQAAGKYSNRPDTMGFLSASRVAAVGTSV